MSAIVKIQKVDRGHTRSFYLNFPAALADVMQVEKGEAFEWILEDKNTVWLRRVVPKPRRSALNAVVKLPKSGGLKVDILSMIVVPDPL